MDDILNCETYLFLSSEKLSISVYSDSNEKIYEKEYSFQYNVDFQEGLRQIDYFFDKNILGIEKKIKNFIKKTNIILELDIFFSTRLSIKDINHDNFPNSKNLNYLSYEARDYCKKTIGERKICHMVIENYQIDDKSYSFFPKHVKGKNFSLDLKFICISQDSIKSLEKILKKYQISIGQVTCKDYISSFFNYDDNDISLLAKKILAGHNPNEIMISNKTIKNHGFFEKFFNFFN